MLVFIQYKNFFVKSYYNFSSGNKVYHLGTTNLDRGLLSNIDNSQFLSYFPLFSKYMLILLMEWIFFH